MPTILESDGQFVTGSVAALPFWELSIDASQSVRKLLDLLDKNVQVPAVLVLEQEKLIGLTPREKVYEKLGRPFGVELFLKMNIKQFYEMLKLQTLVLPSSTLIDDAVKTALMRNAESLYEPVVVAHPNSYFIISMYSLLMAQQEKLQDLYSEVSYFSTTDPLTTINNRRGFFDTVNQRLAMIRYLDLEYAVLMIDIDNFKSVNDRYGHIVGDEVIKSVAQRISTHVRENDVVGRFGGEEFVVFLMDISKESAFDLADKLRLDIASLFHAINGFQIRVTISIGLSHSKGANNTLDKILSEADQAVYVVKKMGRNKVQMWTENLKQPRQTHTIISVTVVQSEAES